ncbi:hypothetical protein QFZ82_000263 [Streptomyces sp. V4I23]|nr:hypothetical protein [Streptomyces sp. V4I23]
MGLPVGSPILAGVHRWSDAEGIIELPAGSGPSTVEADRGRVVASPAENRLLKRGLPQKPGYWWSHLCGEGISMDTGPVVTTAPPWRRP